MTIRLLYYLRNYDISNLSNLIFIREISQIVMFPHLKVLKAYISETDLDLSRQQRHVLAGSSSGSGSSGSGSGSGSNSCSGSVSNSCSGSGSGSGRSATLSQRYALAALRACRQRYLLSGAAQLQQ